MNIDPREKQIQMKIVYYGPGMSGKTTNLQQLHENLPGDRHGKLQSVNTSGDRTLFFDYMPLDMGRLLDFKVAFQLYTVPGQPQYSETRQLCLQGVDAVVFVADSAAERMEDNVESFKDYCDNIIKTGRSPHTIPMVFQYNKRDVKSALSVAELNEKLNQVGLPYYEAQAMHDIGINKTLEGICKIALERAASDIQAIQRPERTTAAPTRGSTTRIGSAVRRKSRSTMKLRRPSTLAENTTSIAGTAYPLKEGEVDSVQESQAGNKPVDPEGERVDAESVDKPPMTPQEKEAALAAMNAEHGEATESGNYAFTEAPAAIQKIVSEEKKQGTGKDTKSTGKKSKGTGKAKKGAGTGSAIKKLTKSLNKKDPAKIAGVDAREAMKMLPPALVYGILAIAVVCILGFVFIYFAK